MLIFEKKKKKKKTTRKTQMTAKYAI